MLEDAREDHKENDATNLRRKCEFVLYIQLNDPDKYRQELDQCYENLAEAAYGGVMFNRLGFGRHSLQSSVTIFFNSVSRQQVCSIIVNVTLH